MISRPAKTLEEIIRKLIPPKSVKRKGNDEGIEPLDCEEEEILLEELEQECDDELCNDDKVEIENVVAEENHDQIGLITISSASKKETSLLSFTSDSEIKKGAKFLDKFQQIMKDSGTSESFIPYMSQFRATFQKARRSIKKRIEVSANPQLSKKDNVELPVEGPLNNAEAATQPMEPATQSNGMKQDWMCPLMVAVKIQILANTGKQATAKIRYMYKSLKRILFRCSSLNQTR